MRADGRDDDGGRLRLVHLYNSLVVHLISTFTFNYPFSLPVHQHNVLFSINITDILKLSLLLELTLYLTRVSA